MMMTMMMISRLWFVSLFFYYSISSMVPRITQQPRFSFVISYVSSLWATFSCIYLILTLSPLGTSIHHYSSSHNIKCSFFSLRLLVSVSSCEGQSFHFVSIRPWMRIPMSWMWIQLGPCRQLVFQVVESTLYFIQCHRAKSGAMRMALLGITVLICTNSGLPWLPVLFIKKGGESLSETQALHMWGAVNYA